MARPFADARLPPFRAGIEANIPCLKRAWGLPRCTWRGPDHFKTYVWSSVQAYDLALFIAVSRPEIGSIWLRPLERPNEEDERHAKRDDDQ